MKKIFLLFAAATVLYSCKKDNDKEKTFEGEKVQLHEGKAWSWLKVDKDGKPKQLGVTINDAAMNSLPIGGEPGHSHENNLVVPLPAKALEVTPFKVVGLDWNPQGHEPENVYTLPHFDFHYYMVPAAEVLGAVDMQKMMVPPAAEFIPANYVAGPPVPQMGLHWVDVTSPELNPTNPQTFTQTFIFGSYNSKLTFYEPMITRQFLLNTNNFERSIPQAPKVQTTGYYPTKMRITKKGGETSVILDGFVHRQA
jgi:hypothetical protein